MKTITLNLVISLIIEAVKTETHIKGRVDKAVDDKASALAYNEEAGDDEFHERKLYRTLHTSLSRLKTLIGDYVDSSVSRTADNIFTVVNKDSDTITMQLKVSDRFNESFAEPLAKLCSKYIEDHILYLWWGTFNVKQAEFYRSLVQIDEQDILSCFTKTAPSVPSTSYTSFIKTQMGNVIRVEAGETFTVTYQVSVDDVEARVDGSVAEVLSKGDNEFELSAKRAGVCLLHLYSRHDEDVSCTIKISVTG